MAADVITLSNYDYTLNPLLFLIVMLSIHQEYRILGFYFLPYFPIFNLISNF